MATNQAITWQVRNADTLTFDDLEVNSIFTFDHELNWSKRAKRLNQIYKGGFGDIPYILAYRKINTDSYVGVRIVQINQMKRNGEYLDVKPTKVKGYPLGSLEVTLYNQNKS